ncbi:MAG: class I SAM-dependent methyltransferase [Candidatus Margulisiibacteriota bacterium]|nr:class I SAM-dependent methyltransferase [Candidatus Margulisiibacteriota bacterium]
MERLEEIIKCPRTDSTLSYFEKEGRRGFLEKDKDIFYPEINGIINFVGPESNTKHKKIGEAYDQSLFMYDDYMEGNKFRWRLLKYLLLGYGYDDIKECENITRKLFQRVKRGIVLEVPIGTGIHTIREYAKHPDILFVAIDYSWGMVKEAKSKIDKMGLKNVVVVRADVAKLPFKDGAFDGLLTLNGIHSFPEKEAGMRQMSRVLKKGSAFFGSLVVKKERWITDLMMELFYFPGKWFCRPALTRNEFNKMLKENKLAKKVDRLIKALVVFESTKETS